MSWDRSFKIKAIVLIESLNDSVCDQVRAFLDDYRVRARDDVFDLIVINRFRTLNKFSEIEESKCEIVKTLHIYLETSEMMEWLKYISVVWMIYFTVSHSQRLEQIFRSLSSEVTKTRLMSLQSYNQVKRSITFAYWTDSQRSKRENARLWSFTYLSRTSESDEMTKIHDVIEHDEVAIMT